MQSIAKALAKATLGTVAAGAMVMGMATPAAAQHHRDRDRDGISAGEVIAGAVVLGGLAAIVASSNNDRHDRDYRYDRRDRRDYRGSYRGGYDNGRHAVEQCVREVERYAQRRTGSRAEVYEIRDVDRERRGFEVEGRIAVRDNYRRGWGRNDYRRGYRNDGWDEGRFNCDIRGGRVVDIDIDGIRGL
jgi:hypothetical protein